MPRTRIGGLASMLAVIGLAALAPSAAAAWTAPQDVSATAANPQVAMDANGDSALAWEFGAVNGRVQGRTMTAAGALAPVFELGSAGDTTADFPRVATDATGDSVFMWAKGPSCWGAG